MSVDADLARTAVHVHSRNLDDVDVAQAFRRTLLSDSPHSSATLVKLFELLGEFVPPPADPHELARWAGKREVAHDLKAALYAPLTNLPTHNEDEEL